MPDTPSVQTAAERATTYQDSAADKSVSLATVLSGTLLTLLQIGPLPSGDGHQSSSGAPASFPSTNPYPASTAARGKITAFEELWQDKRCRKFAPLGQSDAYCQSLYEDLPLQKKDEINAKFGGSFIQSMLADPASRSNLMESLRDTAGRPQTTAQSQKRVNAGDGSVSLVEGGSKPDGV
jgi:hypothetical protein